MFLTVIISFLIAKKIKSDLKQQKINVIKLEIYELKQRLKNRPNEHNDLVLHKIGLLEKELETYS
jgi:membrane protein insertase Oxa1/YidC/SpoIIIJ